MHRVRLAVLALAAIAVLTGCSDGNAASAADKKAPALGACRVLSPGDVAKPANSSPVVGCAKPHTAETYAVGDLPGAYDDVEYDDQELGAWAYRTCSQGFKKFLGADDSLVMRTVVSWAWFRPSEEAWDDGARWYRCDVVGGGEQSRKYVRLPASSKGLLLGRPKDSWLVCAEGDTVSGSVKVPCTDSHNWRAVTTIALGDAKTKYPGDRLAEVKTRDFCSKSVGAWLNYPVDYDFGYTWFHEAEWNAGNRRSVCWAKTPE
ncbi:septum formation family protein [Nocardioides sp. URHA0020]|uniref:septum formation family protein n=1 Tax=Nocardioides sp. URHA0020 TaxID=1380392 RepID=UPI000490A66A|nr:septum formation family protein [Nocardioides sp. URHA0020]